MRNLPPELEPPTRPGGRMTLPRSPAELIEPQPPPAPPRQRRIRVRGEPRRMGGFLRFVNGTLTLAFLTLLTVGGLAFLVRGQLDKPGPLQAPGLAIVRLGDGVDQIAGRLEREGVISSSLVFQAGYRILQTNAWITGAKPVQLRAGEYEIKKGASVRQVLDTLSEGRSILYKVTLPEGLTSQQIVERLRADASLTGDIDQIPAEGSLLPDTYRFPRGASRPEILERMQVEMRRQLAAQWAKRQPNLPVKSMEEALVLASIVEKETGRADERERVAAVFVNRLRKGMRLESDPTIVYGIVGGQGPLGRSITRSDIETRTAYNTYRIDGLPPTAICNPGIAAIKAVLNPAATNDIFFVADGTGGHTFTTNYKDHQAAVANWRRIERAKQGGGGFSGQANASPTGSGAVAAAPGGAQAPPAQGQGAAAQQAPAAGVSGAPGGQAPAAAQSQGQGDIPLPLRKPKR